MAAPVAPPLADDVEHVANLFTTVMGDPGMASNVLACLDLGDATQLRLAAKIGAEAVADYPWGRTDAPGDSVFEFDYDPEVGNGVLRAGTIRGGTGLQRFLTSFPHAVALPPVSDAPRSRITDALLRTHLARFASVELDQCNSVTNAGVAALARASTVSLQYCNRVTNVCLAHLSGVRTLTIIGCKGVSDDGLRHLRGCQRICLAMLPSVTDAGLAHLSHVTTVCLEALEEVTDAGVAQLTGVVNLQLSMCYEVDDNGLSGLSSLRTLELVDMPFRSYFASQLPAAGEAHLDLRLRWDSKARIPDSTLPLYDAEYWQAVGEGLLALPKLAVDTLTLTGCGVVTAYLAHASELPWLRSLDLCQCPRLDDRIFKHCDWLTFLGLDDCPRIEGHGLRHLRHLRNLNVIDCDRLEADFIGVAAKRCAHLQEIVVRRCPRAPANEIQGALPDSFEPGGSSGCYVRKPEFALDSDSATDDSSAGLEDEGAESGGAAAGSDSSSYFDFDMSDDDDDDDNGNEEPPSPPPAPARQAGVKRAREEGDGGTSGGSGAGAGAVGGRRR
jgi:hypothetical protein